MTEKGIQLRALELNDIDSKYVEWYKNSDGHLDYFTGSGRIFTREMLVDDIQNGLENKTHYMYLALSSEGEKFGNIRVGPIDVRNKTADLVCLIGNRSFLGRGLAPKIISLGNQVAFENHDIRRLHGGMYSSNIASIKSYTRAGWFVETVMKGYYYSDGKSEDRVCVACLNPSYFRDNE